MKTYLVFEPAENGKTTDVADRVLFVREKFTLTALLVAPLWLLFHRLWLGFFGWLGAIIVIATIAWWLGFNRTTTAVAFFIPALLVALEGSELRRCKLLRHGYRDAGVTVGEDLEDAERRFFSRWLAGAPASSAPKQPKPSAPVSSLAPLPQTPVIGLFPESGAKR